MTRHLYGISALVTQTLFCEGSSGEVAKRRLFSQATVLAKINLFNPYFCLIQGDQILEWNHVSMVDVSFEQVRKIVADSPEDVTLVVCHNTAW